MALTLVCAKPGTHRKAILLIVFQLPLVSFSSYWFHLRPSPSAETTPHWYIPKPAFGFKVSYFILHFTTAIISQPSITYNR